MGRLAKTGLAILGLAAIGGFVSLLGGPNVFSTFSNAISTLFPESEVAVEKTEENQTQNEVVTLPEPEVREKIGSEEPARKVEEIAADIATQVISEPAKVVTPEPKEISQQPIVSVPSTIPARIPSSAPRGISKPSGEEKYAAPSQTQGAGSEGSGRWCLDAGAKPFMMKKGDTCGGWRLVGEKMVKVS